MTTLEEKLRTIHRYAVEAQTHRAGVLEPKDVAYLVELLTSALLEGDAPAATPVETAHAKVRASLADPGGRGLRASLLGLADALEASSTDTSCAAPKEEA